MKKFLYLVLSITVLLLPGCRKHSDSGDPNAGGGNQDGWTGDPPVPFNPEFLHTPQEDVVVIGPQSGEFDADFALLRQVLLPRSQGGVAVYTDPFYGTAANITARIPMPGGAEDVRELIEELAPVYRVTDFDGELELRQVGVEEGDGELEFAKGVTQVIFQHRCRFDDRSADVAGSQFVATLTEQHLVHLSSTFRPVDCFEPRNLVNEKEVHHRFPSVSSPIVRRLVPAGSIDGLGQDTYVYWFTAGDTFYEVRANDLTVLTSHPLAMGAWGLDRRISDGATLKCQDTDIDGDHNSPAKGTGCSGSFADLYDSLYWAVRPWQGKFKLTNLYGTYGTDWVGWSSGQITGIDFKYAATGNDLWDLGNYIDNGNSGRISLAPHVTDVSTGGPRLTTRKTGASGQSLPGLGGAVDLVAHEMAHGFLAAMLEARHGILSARFLEGSKVVQYTIGRALTEALADAFGKAAEARARFELTCPGARFNQGCGQHSQLQCGSATCLRGESCAAPGQCRPCNMGCPDPARDSGAVMDPKFVHTYPGSGEEIFANGVFFRDLDVPASGWGTIVTCPQDNPVEEIQQYANGLFFSRLLVAYHTAPDRLFGNRKGVLRNGTDLFVGEDLLIETLRHMPLRPTAYDAQRAFSAAYTTVLRTILPEDWNADKINRVSDLILRKPPFPTSPAGQCKNMPNVPGRPNFARCDASSRYICARP